MKKGVSIILIVGLLLLCCCMVVLVGGFFVANSAVAATEPVQELAYKLCDEREDLSIGTYNQVFNQDFKDITTLEETQAYLGEVFPTSFNCSELKGNNIITLMSKGYAISSETNLDETIATYDVSLDGQTLSFYYRYENDKWYVEGMYIE